MATFASEPATCLRKRSIPRKGPDSVATNITMVSPRVITSTRSSPSHLPEPDKKMPRPVGRGSNQHESGSLLGNLFLYRGRLSGLGVLLLWLYLIDFATHRRLEFTNPSAESSADIS